MCRVRAERKARSGGARLDYLFARASPPLPVALPKSRRAQCVCDLKGSICQQVDEGESARSTVPDAAARRILAPLVRYHYGFRRACVRESHSRMHRSACACRLIVRKFVLLHVDESEAFAVTLIGTVPPCVFDPRALSEKNNFRRDAKLQREKERDKLLILARSSTECFYC